MVEELKDLISGILSVLPDCDDLRRKEYRGNSNFYAGHCYVASEALLHLAKKRNVQLKPMFLWHENSPHWYLVCSGEILDLTRKQFSNPPDYTKGKGKGFLTKAPSKRAKELIARVTTYG
jgi:hypothetical protein